MLGNFPGESVELRLGPRQHLEQEVQLMAHFEAQLFDPAEAFNDRSRNDGAHREILGLTETRVGRHERRILARRQPP